MYKRVVALICTLMLLGSMSVPAAAAENLLQNGDFEMVNADGTATGWTGDLQDIKTSTDRRRDGERSLHILTTKGNVLATQHLTHIVAGSKYTISGFVYVTGGNKAKPYIKLEYYDKVGKDRTYLGEETFEVAYMENRWVRFSFSSTAPANAQTVGLLLRAQGAGSAEIFFDTVSFTGLRAEGYVEIPLVPSTETAVSPAPEAVPPSAPEENRVAEHPFSEENAKEFLKNGNLESHTAEGALQIWTISKGGMGKEYLLETEDAPDGAAYIRMVTTGENDLYIAQPIYGLVGLAEYKVSTFVRMKDMPAKRYPTIKIEIFGADGHMEDQTVTFDAVVPGADWEKWEFSFVAPAGASRANFLARIPTKTGEVSYDLLSFKGVHAADIPAVVDPSTFPPVNHKAPAENAQEMMTNLSFEEPGEDGLPANWEVYKGWDGGIVSLEKEIVHSGTTAVKISTDSGNNPWACQKIENVVPGMEYQMSSYFRSPFLSGKGVSYKFEWYDANGVYMGENAENTETMGYLPLITGENWYHFVQHCTPPEGAASLFIYLRLYGAGTVYFDDVSFYRTGDPERFTFETDEYFYYTENEAGYAYAAPALLYYPELANATVSFRLLDGETVLREEANVPVMAEKARFKFYISDLKEKQKPYTVEATMFDASGKSLDTKTETVYRFDRPTALDDYGNYIVDGEIFHPIFGYHVNTIYYPRMHEVGINVVQGAANTATLDAALENNLRVLIVLYNGAQAAGSPDMVETTRRLVAELKDHPAVFGWAVMDEPYEHNKSPLPDLINSYIEIRSIDPVHPVYIVQDGPNVKYTSKCADLCAIDPYPANRHNPADYPAERGMLARDSNGGRKPIYNLLQLFSYGGYFPTVDEIRNMTYQAFMADCTAVGYYEINDTFGGKPVFEVPEPYNTLKEWMEREAEDAFAFFVDQKYPVFNEQKTTDTWSVSYPKDGKLRVIAINRHVDKPVTVSLPLVSTDESVRIDEFSATVYAGGEAKTLSGSGTFTVTLQPAGAVVYEITPQSAVDFSRLSVCGFKDLETHPWARTAIETLAKKEVVYGLTPEYYAPGREITRGEFASFLVRALGLSMEATEQFTDVHAGDRYAPDIAAGKAAGILQGMGDGRFCPERLITRQDMMTMVARGLSLTGTAELSDFSDASLLADYARPHAEAMLANGFIQGNADGTLNPVGFTTRAEAAVMLMRLSA